MTISVASGKGGTGKTTVAVGLALVADRPTVVDCDAEAPNCHLFLRQGSPRVTPVLVPIPRVDARRCKLCGACAAACRFHALAAVGRRLLLFPELCHGCGACLIACPVGALSETQRTVGVLETEQAGDIYLITGRLNEGEATAVPVIRAAKRSAPQDGLVLLDAAPGTACTMVEAVKDSDLCLLVTEPTPFGLHDLEMAIDALRQMGVPGAVVVNRAEGPSDDVAALCRRHSLPLLAEIPLDRRAAEAYSRGEHPLHVIGGWPMLFAQLLERAISIAGTSERYCR